MGESVQLALRLPQELVDGLDRHVQRMCAARPGVDFNRSDAARALLASALAKIESPAPKLSKPRGR
ncbi:MAG TPA: hypothetical protein VGK67_29945 [Myxococcales bacterium]|jgi:hypothetical protein